MTHFGKIRLDNLLWFQVGLLILIPFYTYYMAVYKDGIAPFPHTTVTDTACPYPQDIVFRFGMLTAASFLAVLFYCLFKWFKHVQIKIKYPGVTFPRPYYLIAQFIIFPYTITIGTIDSGGYTDIHSFCAVIFFVGLFGLTVYLTFLLKRMKNWDSSFISPSSWLLKKLTCYWIIAVAIYCGVGVLLDSSKGDDMLVIIQWNIVIVNLLWVLSFKAEWKHMYLTFQTKGEDLVDMLEEQ